jgi:NAD(P)-dependent dehydrogenase (short-subunit alcohol dehydrogenase family)
MDKVILITGASRGIGAATARLAAERGYAVCINYRSRAHEAAELASDIERRGGTVVTVRADVAHEADVIRLFDEVEKQLGPLTALVNNAGMLERQMRVETMPADRLARVFNTNAIGSILCAREAVRRMSRDGRGGAIVNVSSMAARLGSPNEYVDYAASKGAIDTFTIGLSKEVAAQNIRVNAVRPGLIDTDMHASGGEPERIERLRTSVPLQRGGTPKEVAQAIMWLVSDEAAYVTGSFIDVSGGR